MNVLDRITSLRESRNWSEYQLAEKSGLTQSTISSWYRKNMIPSITSLERICRAFDITLSEFFIESTDTAVALTPIHIELLKASEKLNSQQLKQLIIFLNSL